MATVAEVLAKTVKAAGIDTVFGLPGGENAEVLDAFRRQGLGFVLVRNENSAVFMADATARLTGKPGVALTTLGPGAANAYSAMANAYLDRAPVLLLTAQSDKRVIGRHTHQVLDLQASFKPISKMTRELTNVRTQQVVEEALRLTMAGRLGPVHLGISSFMAGQVVVDGNRGNGIAIHGRETNVPDFDAARALLMRAKRPIIVVGLGLEPEKPYEAIRRLAEAAQAPVVVTPKAKGAVPADHPLFVGVIGLTHTDPAYEIVGESDCIIAVGFDVVELVKVWDQEQSLIWIAPWENEDPKLAVVKHEFVGPVGPVLEQLAQTSFNPHSKWGEFRVVNYHDTQTQHKPVMPKAERLLPQAVLDLLRRHVPRRTVVTTDVGAHKIFFALQWPAYVPNSYLVANGLSSMGMGLPAAIAAARVSQETTICIIGDGGMAMVMGELGLLRDLDLPVIVVVMNDNALDLIRSAQIRRGKPVFGTEFVNPDYAHIARAFDINFYRVGSDEACEGAVKTAVAANRPVLIEALIDPVGYPTTPKRD